MSRRTLAAALVVLVTVSVLLALVPAQAHPSSSPTSGAHPAAFFAETVNVHGFPTTVFHPGQAGGATLYFLITDYADHAVNVTIVDPNAARDHVPSPAFHYEAILNATTSSFNSVTAGVGYTFPANLTYGGQWTVNFSAPVGGVVLETVSVELYGITVSTSVGGGATLPAQTVTVFWDLFLWSNEASLYTGATNVSITGTYRGNGTVQNFFPKVRVALTPADAGLGQWNGAIPANATPDSFVHFEVSALTIVSGIVTENESANVTINVGTLSISNYGITMAPPSCTLVNDYYFATGSLIASCVLVGADYYGDFSPISGLPVTVAYWNGTHHVTPTGGAPTALVTNVSGEAAFTFTATSPPFVQEFQYPGVDALNFSVTVPGASTHYQWTQWLNATWTLIGGSTASGIVSVALDHSQYYPGTTATATWAIASTNFSKTGAISAIAWTVTGPVGSGVTYAQGILNHTVATGTFTFPITEAMAPRTITVEVYAANATEGFTATANAMVLSPTLLLTPSSTYYDAGSTIQVTAVLSGGGLNTSIQYELWEQWATTEALLGSGTVANGSTIRSVIPSLAPPTTVEVDAWATASGQVIASRTIELSLAQGYSILLGVSTPSSYSDGSYQPGQTITLSYQVVAVGGIALPRLVSFDLTTIGYPTEYAIQNVNDTGSLSFTIPSNAAQGTLLVELAGTGVLAAGPCFPSGACIGIASLLVNPNPSVFNLELAPGSGVTVGWMILLILVIVVAIVLVILIRRRGGSRPTSSSTTLSPPAPAPTGEPAAEWQPPAQEPQPTSGSSSSPPPLPEPSEKS